MIDLLPLDVIWIRDECIRPPGPKMVVCIDPDQGFFFRINSEGKWQYPVAILKVDNRGLQWDSFIECGEPLELDEYVIGSDPPIGAVNAKSIPEIVAAVERAYTLSPADVRNIKRNLGVA